MPPRVVLSVFSTFAVGGAQVRFTSIANHFGPRYRHAIIAMSGQTECRERLDPTLDVSFPTLSFRKGDTLHGLSLQHHISVKALMDANNLTTTTIVPGKKLVIPKS